MKRGWAQTVRPRESLPRLSRGTSLSRLLVNRILLRDHFSELLEDGEGHNHLGPELGDEAHPRLQLDLPCRGLDRFGFCRHDFVRPEMESYVVARSRELRTVDVNGLEVFRLPRFGEKALDRHVVPLRKNPSRIFKSAGPRDA